MKYNKKVWINIVYSYKSKVDELEFLTMVKTSFCSHSHTLSFASKHALPLLLFAQYHTMAHISTIFSLIYGIKNKPY